MEIVKRGERPEDKRWQATCDYCGTIMRYGSKNIRLSKGTRIGDKVLRLEHHDGGYALIETTYKGAYKYVSCPVCRKEVRVQNVGAYSDTHWV